MRTKKNYQITAKKQNIAWLTHKGIKFPNGLWVSGMEISFSLGLKKPLKLARGKEKVQPLGGKIFFPWANFLSFFNPWEEEISIPETQPIWKSFIHFLPMKT